MDTNKDILYREESFAIIGACFNVYNDIRISNMNASFSNSCLFV